MDQNPIVLTALAEQSLVLSFLLFWVFPLLASQGFCSIGTIGFNKFFWFGPRAQTLSSRLIVIARIAIVWLGAGTLGLLLATEGPRLLCQALGDASLLDFGKTGWGGGMLIYLGVGGMLLPIPTLLLFLYSLTKSGKIVVTGLPAISPKSHP